MTRTSKIRKLSREERLMWWKKPREKRKIVGRGRPKKEGRKNHHITLDGLNSKFLRRVGWVPGEKSNFLDKAVECARRLDLKSADGWKFPVDTRNLRPKFRLP